MAAVGDIQNNDHTSVGTASLPGDGIDDGDKDSSSDDGVGDGKHGLRWAQQPLRAMLHCQACGRAYHFWSLAAQSGVPNISYM